MIGDVLPLLYMILVNYYLHVSTNIHIKYSVVCTLFADFSFCTYDNFKQSNRRSPEHRASIFYRFHFHPSRSSEAKAVACFSKILYISADHRIFDRVVIRQSTIPWRDTCTRLRSVYYLLFHSYKKQSCRLIIRLIPCKISKAFDIAEADFVQLRCQPFLLVGTLHMHFLKTLIHVLLFP